MGMATKVEGAAVKECGHCRDCNWWGGKTDSQEPHKCYLMGTEQAKMVNEDHPFVAYSHPDFGCVQFEAKSDAD